MTFEWTCPDCNEKLSASALDIISTRRAIHEGFHRRERLKRRDPNVVILEEVLVWDRELRREVTWFDVEFLHRCQIDPIIDDLRTPEQMAMRYRPRTS